MMSLIPYNPQEGREIVLRHRNAIVVRDSTSHRLEIRGLTECPTCRRPLGSPSERTYENPYETTTNHDSYVNPDYFRMLQSGTQDAIPRDDPPSPVRRLFNPALTGAGRGRSVTPEASSLGQDDGDEGEEGDAEFVSSAPGVSQNEGNRIRRQAFSPGYFKTFFKEEKVLGRGGKGVVLLVRHEIDNCDLGYFACKRVPVGDDHAWLEKVLVEVGLLNKLSHPNLVSYRHVWLETARLTRFGPSVVCAFILQQYCNGGDLHQYLVGSAPQEVSKEELKARARRRSKGHLDTPQSLFSGMRQLAFEEIFSLFRDITAGVAYLHSNEYIHRDLKPSNCLLHREGGKLRCLISDFGEVQPENVLRKSTGSTGTISYCAPEVLKVDANGRYINFTTKSDIFSLGMILYFMCFGKLPYRSSNALQEELEDIDELREEITAWQGFRDERRERPDLPHHLYILLKKLLSLNPVERPSANEVLSAMRGEITFEPTTRAERNHRPSSIGLHMNRVQNLDSPAGPSTPISDPHKPARPTGATASGTEIVASSAPNPFNRTGLPSQELPHRTSEAVQVQERPHPMTITEITDSQDGSLQGDEYEEMAKEPDERRPSRPLLMAPPTTRAAELQLQARIIFEQIAGMVGLDRDVPNRLFRLSFFFIKMVSLIRPCYPYMPNLMLSVPLIVVAALDLKVPRISMESVLARQTATGEIEFGAPPFRGLRSSIALLIIHVGVLWMASHFSNLCLGPSREELSDWYRTSTMTASFSTSMADNE